MNHLEPKQECVESLRGLRPDVAIRITRTVDHGFVWDGEGPDPREEGLNPCDVAVKASRIVGGRMFRAVEYLGGCYFLPEEPTGDVHGYLPQMVEEAVARVDEMVETAIKAGEGKP